MTVDNNALLNTAKAFFFCAQPEIMPDPHHSLTMMGYLFIMIRVCFDASRDSTIKSYLVGGFFMKVRGSN